MFPFEPETDDCPFCGDEDCRGECQYDDHPDSWDDADTYDPDSYVPPDENF